MANDQSVVLWKHLKRFAEQFMEKVNGSVYPTIKAGTYGIDNEELFEDTVTENSKKGVQSGAVHTAVQGVYTDVKAGTYGTDNEELFEDTITASSKKAIQSGAVYTALQGKLTTPELPSVDGTYTLQCVIADGAATLSWVSA